jgi:5-(carboxyamino)imidazole ribonucleotide mutase
LSPSVGILVGSDSDLPVLEKCTARLEGYGIEYELEVRSAHRNPEGVSEYAGTLSGFDALLATVQMPTGVPVATVAVNGAANAAVLAAQILALSDPELAERLER